MISSVNLTKGVTTKRLSLCGKTLVETTVYRTPIDGEFMYKVVRNGYLSKGWKVSIKTVRLLRRRDKKRTEDTNQSHKVMDLPFKGGVE